MIINEERENGFQGILEKWSKMSEFPKFFMLL